MKPIPHLPLLIWLTLTGLVVFGSVVCVDQGLIQTMIDSDRSYICIVIIAMYFVGLGHTFRRTTYLSKELNCAVKMDEMLQASAGQALYIDGRALRLDDGTPLPPGFVSDYIVDFDRAKAAAASTDTENGEQSDLLDAYASEVRKTNEFGWFYIDVLLKVGFLGTLVGFILMLGSISETAVVDATSMQKVLKQMSFGMSTALYTTLASLVAGILLAVPYHLLERSLNTLLETTVYLKEVHILPRLNGDR